LIERYGAHYPAVEALIEEDAGLAEPLIAGLRALKAEALFAIRHEQAVTIADVLAQRLRKEGIAAEVSFRRSSPGNQMKRADALGARFALVLGDAELKSGRARLKEMKTAAEHEIDLADLPAAVRKLSK
jgi:histidyl-tRNA synthetase